YLSVLRHRWRAALVAFLIVSEGTAAGLSMRPPVYKATGLLEIKPESAGAVSIETLFGSDRVATDELETQFGILKSHSLAERVVAQLEQERAEARADGNASGTPLPKLSLGEFRDALIVSPKKGSRLVEVSFTSSNPALAERVVNAVFDNYMEMRREDALSGSPKRGSRLVEVSFTSSNPALAERVVNAVFGNYMEMRREDAQRSVSWLEEQLEAARERLEASEIRLQSLPETVGVEVLE